jgi:hypothetical protein
MINTNFIKISAIWDTNPNLTAKGEVQTRLAPTMFSTQLMLLKLQGARYNKPGCLPSLP